MATFKNTSGTDLEVSVDGINRFVEAGGVFDVPDEHADRLRSQPAFTESKTADKAAEKEKN
jgi:hypothetical protein